MNEIYAIYERFIEDSKSNFLMMPLFTGSGKTRQMQDLMMDSLRSGSDRRFIFITPLIKNLHREKFEAMLEQHGIDPRKDCLFVEGNVDSIVKNYSKEYRKKIRDAIGSDTLVDSLEVQIQAFKATEDKIARGKVRAELEQLDRELRKELRRALREAFQDIKDRGKAVSSGEWSWVKDLFPAVRFSESKVVFMSVDKFLLPFDTLVDRPVKLWCSDSIDGCIIVIDEFDSCKETMCKSIAGSAGMYDALELFDKIHAGLSRKKNVPTNLFLRSSNWNGAIEKTPEALFDSCFQAAEDLENKYRLLRKLLMEDGEDHEMIFHDSVSHTARSNKTYYVRYDEERNVNCLVPNSDGGSENYSLFKVLGDFYYFKKRFVRMVNGLSFNYMSWKGKGNITRVEAIETVLDHFNFDHEQKAMLIDEILITGGSRTVDLDSSPMDDYSFYEDGFQVYDVENSRSHDLSSKLRAVEFALTPEKILRLMCQKAKVIGISATACIDSVLGNFDMRYLRSCPGFKEMSLTGEEKAGLCRIRDEHNRNTGDVEVSIVNDCGKSYCISCWNSLFPADSDDVSKLREKIERATTCDDGNAYVGNRYLRIARAFDAFIAAEDSGAGFCFLNKHPKPSDENLDLNLLNEIFRAVGKKHGVSNDSYGVMFLTGDSYDETLGAIRENLKSGKKQFVVTAYQTVGAGQNIQYTKGGKSVDFDFIYLDKPTHVTPQIGPMESGSSYKDLYAYLFEIGFLRERGEISRAEAEMRYGAGFSNFLRKSGKRGRRGSEKMKGMDCDSIRAQEAIVVIQALGRISRGGSREGTVRILADCNLSSSFTKPIEYYSPYYTKELGKLYEGLAAKKESPDEAFTKDAEAATRRSLSFIQARMRLWNERTIETWKRMRLQVLRHPTLSSAPSDSEFPKLYLALMEDSDRLFYREEGDFRTIKISQTDSSLESEVSDEAARLKGILAINGMEKMFKERGFATCFEKGAYILTPPAYRNIYLGALGEVAGRYILESIFQLELKEIEEPDRFEMFDFTNGNGVYLDMKHWRSSEHVDAEYMREKIVRKLESIGGKKVLIVNLINNGGDWKEFHVSEDGRVIEIPYLYDVDQKEFNRNGINLIREAWM